MLLDRRTDLAIFDTGLHGLVRFDRLRLSALKEVADKSLQILNGLRA